MSAIAIKRAELADLNSRRNVAHTRLRAALQALEEEIALLRVGLNKNRIDFDLAVAELYLSDTRKHQSELIGIVRQIMEIERELR